MNSSIYNRVDSAHCGLFLQLEEGAIEEVMTRNCLRKDPDLILGKMLLITE